LTIRIPPPRSEACTEESSLSRDIPGGKIEAGEIPEDAAVRETHRETGLRSGLPGDRERAHPRAGVVMVYAAAELAGDAYATAETGDELTEARWVSPAEVGESMNDMHEGVRRHMHQTSGGHR
jgi:8-oxo-dGTP diphosphatase